MFMLFKHHSTPLNTARVPLDPSDPYDNMNSEKEDIARSIRLGHGVLLPTAQAGSQISCSTDDTYSTHAEIP